MASVKIVTDSTADIPKHLVNELGIMVVPLKVHFGEETYLDGVNLQAEEFYKKLTSTAQLPTTSQPSPAEFVEAYKQIQAAEGEDVHIISIHLSSALSGTVQSAHLATNLLEESKITVIDSKKAAYVIGVIVVEVARAAQQGWDAQACIDLAEQLIRDTTVYFMVGTLEYLQKGGRIGRASALLGSLLNIKPILSLNEQGEVYPVDKVRGSKKAISRILQLMGEQLQEENVSMAICHSAVEQEATALKTQLEQEFKVADVLVTDIGPVIGTHVGPGTIGVIMSKRK